MLVASACRPGFSLLRRLQVGVLAEALGQRKTLCMADEAKAVRQKKVEAPRLLTRCAHVDGLAEAHDQIVGRNVCRLYADHRFDNSISHLLSHGRVAAGLWQPGDVDIRHESERLRFVARGTGVSRRGDGVRRGLRVACVARRLFYLRDLGEAASSLDGRNARARAQR